MHTHIVVACSTNLRSALSALQDEGGLDAVEQDMFLKLNTVVLLRFLDSCCDYVSPVRSRQCRANMQQDPGAAVVCKAAFCAAP